MTKTSEQKKVLTCAEIAQVPSVQNREFENRKMMATELTVQPKNEIVVYRPNATTNLEVRLDEDTVWLAQSQMAELFGCTVRNVRLHLANIFKCGELDETATGKDFFLVRNEGNRQVTRKVTCYNLDAIISVGYRVNSVLGVKFRQWATGVLKEYLLRRAVVNVTQRQLAEEMDRRFAGHEKRLAAVEQSVDAIVKYALPAPEQVFVNGQFLDAHVELLKIIRTAKKRIVLIDNFIDERVFTLLAERGKNVACTIYSRGANKRETQLAASRYSQQYPTKPITLIHTAKSHDRFLIIDNTVWHIGASPKDAGARIFALMKMELDASVILGLLK